MRIRVVRCPEDAHDTPWAKAGECGHWPRKCPSPKKAKKNKHRLTYGEPGFLVAITACDNHSTGTWLYDYDPPDYALALTERRYKGFWTRDLIDQATGQPVGSKFVPAPTGHLITCTQCDLVAAS